MRAASRAMAAQTSDGWNRWARGHVDAGNGRLVDAIGRIVGEERERCDAELYRLEKRIQALEAELDEAKAAVAAIIAKPEASP